MNNYYEQIGDYLNGTLADEELVAFQNALKEDVNLQKAVDNHSVVEQSLELLIEEDIRNVIGEIELQESAPEKVKADGARSYLIGLLIALLLGLFAYFYNQSKEPDPEILFAEFYSEYISPEVRGTETNLKDLSTCDQGHALMQEENFSEAKELFIRGASLNDSCNDKAQWYLALIYLKENNITEARNLLSEIIGELGNIYSTKAQQLYDRLD